MLKDKLRHGVERHPCREGVSRRLPAGWQNFSKQRSGLLSLSLPNRFSSADDASARQPGDQRGIQLNRQTVTAALDNGQDA